MQLCAVTSCGVSSNLCAAKWEGAPTTAVRHVGRNPTRPSCRLRPFRRCGLGVEPCSDNIGQSAVDDDLDLAVQIISARTAAAAFCVAVKRIVQPASRALQGWIASRRPPPQSAARCCATAVRPPRSATPAASCASEAGRRGGLWPRIARPSADCDAPSCVAVRPRTIKGSCCVTAKSDVSTLTSGCERSSLRPNLPPP
jgi:hypothetical protein